MSFWVFVGAAFPMSLDFFRVAIDCTSKSSREHEKEGRLVLNFYTDWSLVGLKTSQPVGGQNGLDR